MIRMSLCFLVNRLSRFGNHLNKALAISALLIQCDLTDLHHHDQLMYRDSVRTAHVHAQLRPMRLDQKSHGLCWRNHSLSHLGKYCLCWT